MQSDIVKASAVALSVGLFTALPAAADPFSFSTGAVTNLMATASRPSTGAPFEIESADDFAVTSETKITSATFTGLVTGSPHDRRRRRPDLRGIPQSFECWPDERSADLLDK